MVKKIKNTQTDNNSWTNKQLWLVLLFMYIYLLSGVGYIAFWNQDFNNTDKLLSQYEVLRTKHIEVLKKVYADSNSDLHNHFDDDGFNTMLTNSMKSTINSAGDLQELASQSFNIILGAVLAFLSATATMVFQNSFKRNEKETKDEEKNSQPVHT